MELSFAIVVVAEDASRDAGVPTVQSKPRPRNCAAMTVLVVVVVVVVVVVEASFFFLLTLGKILSRLSVVGWKYCAMGAVMS